MNHTVSSCSYSSRIPCSLASTCPTTGDPCSKRAASPSSHKSGDSAPPAAADLALCLSSSRISGRHRERLPDFFSYARTRDRTDSSESLPEVSLSASSSLPTTRPSVRTRRSGTERARSPGCKATRATATSAAGAAAAAAAAEEEADGASGAAKAAGSGQGQSSRAGWGASLRASQSRRAWPGVAASLEGETLGPPPPPSSSATDDRRLPPPLPSREVVASGPF
jgi:hypothetical protein